MHWIGTSWKMHKTRAEALAYAARLCDAPPTPGVHRFVVPPFTALRDVVEALDATDITVGAQNMHWQDDGPWTGEISAPMLRDCGATLVEIGHSERRSHFAETDDTVGLKVAAALRHGLLPLICVGETAGDRAAGKTGDVLARQVTTALAHVPPDARVLFAYEPVWAIGTDGTPATPEDADIGHRRIKAAADRLITPPPCLYGGSVTADNCADLIAEPHVDGLFIGRAAWAVDGYLDILKRCAPTIATKEPTP